MAQKTFAQLWNPNPMKHRTGIAVLSLLGGAVIIGSLGITLSIGLVAGWQLAAAAGFTAASLGGRSLVTRKMKDKIIGKIGTPAPADLQLMAEKIYHKAGLSQKPVVRIINTNQSGKKRRSKKKKNKQAGNTTMDHGAFTIPMAIGPNKDQILIGIGHKALQNLNRDEIAAVIAHETGHIMNEHPKMNIGNRASQVLGSGLILSSILFFNPAAGMIFIAAHLVQSALIAKASRLDEDRADRNSYGLFPHRDALRTSLQTLKSNMLKARYPNGPTAAYRANRLLYWLYGTHYETDRRIEEVKCHYDEAKSFYKKNGLADDTGYISGTGQNGMKKISRPKPGTLSKTKPLTASWNKKSAGNDNQKNITRKKKGNGPSYKL